LIENTIFFGEINKTVLNFFVQPQHTQLNKFITGNLSKFILSRAILLGLPSWAKFNQFSHSSSERTANLNKVQTRPYQLKTKSSHKISIL